MARREAKPPERTRRRYTRAAIAAVLGVAVLAGIAILGSLAGARIGPRDRYLLPIDAIDCQPPPWVDAATFWAEVRYLGDLPDRFTTTDAESVDRVRAAIAKHPWVEFVANDGYMTVAGRYVLTVGFRRPILAVAVAAPPGIRTVDGNGVLLPAHEPMNSLARLVGSCDPPAGPAGTTWNHPTVRRAAELAAQYDAESIERTASGWRVVRRNGPTLTLER
jgi:hypothetical protein